MIALTLVDVLAAGGVTVLATLVLVRIAAKKGLVDDAQDAPDRKSHSRAVPLVGGLAIAAAVGALYAWRGRNVLGGGVLGGRVLGGEVIPGIAFDSDHVLVALVLALVTGVCDDGAPRGISVGWKLFGQTLAALALALGLQHSGAPATPLAMALCVLVGVAAQNAANTFDNADGALCGVAAAGLACTSPFFGAVIAFLPFNLGGSGILRRVPRAWLGDGGSHLLGLLLLTTPVAWAALVLPALDLARVACARAAEGRPVWRGDRRHLAHLLEARGLAPVVVVLVLVVLASPAIAAACFLGRP